MAVARRGRRKCLVLVRERNLNFPLAGVACVKHHASKRYFGIEDRPRSSYPYLLKMLRKSKDVAVFRQAPGGIGPVLSVFQVSLFSLSIKAL